MMMPPTLAIDFGTKRIGLAISRASLAMPLEILPNTDQALARLQAIIAEHAIEQLVVGISEGAMAEQTRAFVSELQAAIALPVHFADETLSSHSVHAKLRQANSAKRREPIDHFAAAEFLQEWLDEQAYGTA
jgi:putative Holliday junction resolvase